MSKEPATFRNWTLNERNPKFYVSSLFGFSNELSLTVPLRISNIPMVDVHYNRTYNDIYIIIFYYYLSFLCRKSHEDASI